LKAVVPRAALAGVVLLCACATAPGPPRDSIALTVGVHDVELIVPDGWQHYDHGREQRFESGFHQITLTDMGPAMPEAFAREIAYARELYRRGQVEDARSHLRRLRLRRAFPTERSWRESQEPWNVVWGKGGFLDLRLVEQAYTTVLARVSALPDPDLPAVARVTLEEIGHDERRDVAEEEALVIAGRDALRVDTWDRLHHDLRKRHVFVLNEGSVLVARMELGWFAEMEAAFDALVASLELPEG
jgi:hypothetical protein